VAKTKAMFSTIWKCFKNLDINTNVAERKTGFPDIYLEMQNN
jgi:hypothetical protein